VASLDNHEDKIWALAVSEDEKTIVSGAADSVVTFWGDCTEVDEKEKVEKLEKLVAKLVYLSFSLVGTFAVLRPLNADC
jgi:U3 small nucleolar RNA-associated protein 13